jgi:hypothetical protein
MVRGGPPRHPPNLLGQRSGIAANTFEGARFARCTKLPSVKRGSPLCWRGGGDHHRVRNQTARRETESAAGDPQVDPGHEPGNPLWGAPRIHGELLKLGIDVGQTSVAKYTARRRGGPSQGWRTFLSNHTDGILSMDVFVVPTVSFRLLYGF